MRALRINTFLAKLLRPTAFGSKQAYSVQHVGVAWVARVWDCHISHPGHSRLAFSLSYHQSSHWQDEIFPTAAHPKNAGLIARRLSSPTISGKVPRWQRGLFEAWDTGKTADWRRKSRKGACVIYCPVAWSFHASTVPLRFILTSEEQVHKDKVG